MEAPTTVIPLLRRQVSLIMETTLQGGYRNLLCVCDSFLRNLGQKHGCTRVLMVAPDALNAFEHFGEAASIGGRSDHAVIG
ncbi:hypothetical protein EGR_08294 [Echinococcus granulosus]|uniref:Uncharacterized protein n=1 Tax=Echinococcus granulosus TaxID=6210 RepID=W6U6I4_ECHGR|nr:hypothetical protein EGR_08294 [Echinococcus granulosus]EUB56825.1 hypothetical protein EGR_08294 [Echinococcus granulosus]